MPASESIRQLVERFEQHRDAYRAGKYNETQLRREFLDPFFEALGWDVFNKLGYSEENKHVIHEDSLEIEGAKKAPDYAFKIGKERKFFVEAKKPSVRIETNPEVAFQLKRYVWSAKLPLGILTDFEEFAVYECRSKPKVTASVKTGRVMLLNYTDYIEKWDEIVSIFSHDAVMTGRFDKFANSVAKKKGTAEVDSAFLAEIEGWREALAKNIALRNKEKIQSEADLNYAVQMTIDRMIFLRICEDRGYESEYQLQGIANPPPPSLRDTSPKSSADLGEEGRVYAGLKKLFERADRRYNSGLFHFKDEKGRGRADAFTTGLEIDDKVLKDIIKDLYYPAPYVFALIPADILGQIYEQFLGKVIRLTASGNAKVEEKPEVRKAGGVYYTPTFIVDTIVENTLGKLLNPTPPLTPPHLGTNGEGEMTPKEAARLKILDPACGSGTFLLGAYQYLLDWHLNWYINNDPEKWSKGKKPAIFRTLTRPASRDTLSHMGEGWKLSVEKKKEILLNNIYGVDIDPQAVEVTKLSLLLKVIEDPGQLSYLDERILPDLGRNIQCGNSLIGPDYWDGQLMVSEEERARVNAFNWKAAFPEVFAQGGFDVVVGNPPYNAGLTPDEEKYMQTRFESVKTGRQDTAAIFVEKGLQISKGSVMFLLPYRLISRKRNHGQFQQWLYHNSNIQQVVYLGKLADFKNVNDEFMTLLVSRSSTSENVMNVAYDITPDDIKDGKIRYSAMKQENWGPPNYDMNIRLGKFNQNLLEKIRSCSIPMGDIAESRDGIVPFIREKLVSLEQKDERYKPLLGIRGYYQLGRYEYSWGGTYLCYDIEEAKKFIKDKVELRKVQLRDESIFLKPEKILTAQDSATIKGTLDLEKYYVTNSIHNTFLKDNLYNIRYVLGLLNSHVVNYYHQSLVLKGQDLHPQVLVTNLPKLPIHAINFSDPAEKAQHDKMVSLVERMLALHKSLKSAHNPQEADRLTREVESVDKSIDGLVYELYGLSEDEIGIVEGK